MNRRLRNQLIALTVLSLWSVPAFAQDNVGNICDRLGIEQRQASLETRIGFVRERRDLAQRAHERASAALTQALDCTSNECLTEAVTGFTDLPAPVRDDLSERSAHPNLRRLVLSTLLTFEGRQNSRLLIEVTALDALLAHKVDLAAIRFECEFQQARRDLGFAR